MEGVVAPTEALWTWRRNNDVTSSLTRAVAEGADPSQTGIPRQFTRELVASKPTDERQLPDFMRDGVDWEELATSPPLPASKIAEKLRQPVNLVERVLRYQRQVQPFCFVKDDSPQKGGSRYLHKLPDVLPSLKTWLEKRLKKQSNHTG